MTMDENHNLPTGWAKASLSELLDFVIGGDWGQAPEHTDPNCVPVLCIRASEVRNWKTEKGSTAALRRVKRSSLETRRLKENDLVIEISGGGPDQPVGRTLLIDKECLAKKPDIPKICTNFFRLMRPSAHIGSSYLQLFLEHFYATRDMSRYQGGSNNLRNLKFDDYLSIEIPLAPSREQRRIVVKMEELFSELDKGIESLTTAREQLKTYRQSVLRHAFEGKLTADFRDGKPPAWATLHIAQLLGEPLCNGRSVKDRTGGFPVLRLTALRGGRVDLTESKEGDWNRANALPFLVSSGDFFVARGNGSIQLVGIGGLVSEATREVAFPDTMIRLRLNPACVDPRYFALCWNSRVVRQQIEREARTTAGIYKINQDHISHFMLPVPPIEEQRLIVSRIDEKLSEADSAIEQISNDLQRGVALRQSILKKAFSGQLVAQWPNDEPASVLLERIRAGRESVPRKNGRSKNGHSNNNSGSKSGRKNREKQFA